MLKLTRLAYNSENWQRPTGDACKYEAAGTYTHENGFGHEEWLFRNEWLIDGWRYSFLQGVNKSYTKLITAKAPIDVVLFTLQPDRRRRLVATIRDVECLDEQQASDALQAFEKRGWLKIMFQEIKEINGNRKALGAAESTRSILNIRFRCENLHIFPLEAFVPANDPIQRLHRYRLYDMAQLSKPIAKILAVRSSGSETPPGTRSFLRSGVGPIECTPEHARMQAVLMEQLRIEFPKAIVVREKDFVDISVRTKNELLLYEIKSDLDPRSAIRRALGQILEYAYHPSRQQALPDKLVIVGRRPLLKPDSDYLQRLKNDFHLPIYYRFVDI